MALSSVPRNFVNRQRYQTGAANATAALQPNGPGIPNAWQSTGPNGSARLGFGGRNPVYVASSVAGAPPGQLEYPVDWPHMFHQAVGFGYTATSAVGPPQACLAAPVHILGRAAAGAAAPVPAQPWADEAAKMLKSRAHLGAGFEMLVRGSGMPLPAGLTVDAFLAAAADEMLSGVARGQLVEVVNRDYLLVPISMQSAMVIAKAWAAAAAAVDPSRAGVAGAVAAATAAAAQAVQSAGLKARRAVLDTLKEGAARRWAAAYAAELAAAASQCETIVDEAQRILQTMGGQPPTATELPPYAAPHIHPGPRSKMPLASQPPGIAADYVSMGLRSTHGGLPVAGEHKLLTLHASPTQQGRQTAPGAFDHFFYPQGHASFTPQEIAHAAQGLVKELFVTTSSRGLPRANKAYAFPPRRMLDSELPRLSADGRLLLRSRAVALGPAVGGPPNAVWGVGGVPQGTSPAAPPVLCAEAEAQHHQRMVVEFGGAHLFQWSW